jgi:hypothetical protein
MDPGGYSTNYYNSNHGQVLPAVSSHTHQNARTASTDPQQYGTYQQATQTYRNAQDWYGDVNQSSSNIQRDQEAAGTLSSFGASSQPGTSTAQHNTNSGHQQTQYSYNTAINAHGVPGASVNQSYGNSQGQDTYANAQGQGRYNNTQSYAGQLQQRPNSVNSVASSHTQHTQQRRTSQATQADSQAHNNYYQHQQIAQTYVSEVDRSVSPAQIQASHQLQNLQADNRAVQQQAQTSEHITIDPSRVYDPWPEYQRQKEVQEAKEREEAQVRAEIEAAEKAKAKADMADKQRRREEARKAQEKEEARQAEEAEDPESEIRNLMAAIRDMSGKHPTLLAKIWEQERQSYLKETVSPGAKKPQKQTATPSSSKHQPSPRPISSAQSTPSARPVSRHPPASPPYSASPMHKSPVQPPPQPGPRRKSNWPEDKKQQVTIAALTWLQQNPKNRGINLSRQAFLDILSGNPTYIELCENLGAMGMDVNRADFAGILIPIINEPSSVGAAAQPNEGRKVVGSGKARAHASPPSGTFHATPAMQLAGSSDNSVYQSPVAHQPWRLSPAPVPFSAATANYDSGRQSMDWQPTPFGNDSFRPLPAPTQSGNFRRPSATPVPKESPPVPSEPLSKADAARKRKFDDLIDLTTLSDDDLPPPPKRTLFKPLPLQQSHLDNGFDGVNGPPRPPQTGQANTESTPVPSHLTFLQTRGERILEERTRNIVMTQQLNPRKAMRRSTYNPATIARDVLLATGKHPDLAPLNGHLEILRTTLAKLGVVGHRVDTNSDLSSIRWDMIDPGKPVKLQKRPEPVKVPEEEEVTVQPAPARKDVVARDVAAVAADNARATQIASTISKNATASQPNISTPQPVIPRKRGRPPRVSDPTLESSSLTMYSAPRPAIQPSSAPKPSKKVSSTASGYTALKAAQALAGITPPRRGRPVGWRKHIHQKSDHGTEPANSSLRTRLDVSPDPNLTPAPHSVFACKWAGCKAKLHNLDTLRKHMRKVHAAPVRTGSQLRECRWQGCGKVVSVRDPETGAIGQRSQFNSFGDVDAWSNHVEQSHIGPVSWLLGDGPPGGFLGESD